MANRSFGMMRFMGSLGFVSFALIAFSALRNRFGVDLEAEVLGDLSGKGKVLMGVSVLAGLIGLVFGQGLGLRIRIRSEDTQDMIDAVWHFTANSSLFWVPAMSAVMAISMGKVAAMTFVRERGVMGFGLSLAVPPLILGAVIAICLFRWSRALAAARRAFSYLFVVRGLPFLAGIATGVVMVRNLPVSPLWGIGLGLLYAPVVIPISLEMIRKDHLRRETL